MTNPAILDEGQTNRTRVAMTASVVLHALLLLVLIFAGLPQFQEFGTDEDAFAFIQEYGG